MINQFISALETVARLHGSEVLTREQSYDYGRAVRVVVGKFPGLYASIMTQQAEMMCRPSTEI